MLLCKRLLKAPAQHDRGTAWCAWINIDHLSTTCGRCEQVRFLPTTTQTFTKDNSNLFPATRGLLRRARHVWISATRRGRDMACYVCWSLVHSHRLSVCLCLCLCRVNRMQNDITTSIQTVKSCHDLVQNTLPCLPISNHNWMERFPCWEANSFLASHKFLSILWHQHVHCRVHNSLSLSWARSVQSTICQPLSVRFVILE